jgi:hypothetical protein
MKKLLLLLAICAIGSIAKSQITLEHAFPNAVQVGSSNKTSSLIDLGDSVFNYLLMDSKTSKYTLYNLNHSLNVTDTFPVRYGPTAYTQYGYFSRSLFDCDTSNIEFLLFNIVNSSSSKWYSYVSIYRTDGTRIFFRDSSMVYLSYGSSAGGSQIVVTPNGTKLMIKRMNGDLEIYSLCGKLPTSYAIMKEPTGNNLSAPYPNPSMSYTRIDYTLPENVKFGEIVFYDIRGAEVKRFKVDHNFSNLELNTNDLSAGNYYYNLQISGKATEGKKLVVIK